jgi:hypothetical protein
MITGNSLDFGRVLVNTNKEMTLTITNNSGTAMSGTLNVPAPFTCVASLDAGMTGSTCNYNLAPLGGTNRMTIRFTPPSVGGFSGNASLSGNPALTFGLTGIGYSQTIKFIES